MYLDLLAVPSVLLELQVVLVDPEALHQQGVAPMGWWVVHGPPYPVLLWV